MKPAPKPGLAERYVPWLMLGISAVIPVIIFAWTEAESLIALSSNTIAVIQVRILRFDVYLTKPREMLIIKRLDAFINQLCVHYCCYYPLRF